MNQKESVETLRQKSEYKRSLHHNYLIIEDVCMDEEADSELRMITENTISGFLMVQVKNENGMNNLYYEVSSMQPLLRIYETRKMTQEELLHILAGVIHVFEQAKEYLLSEEQLVLAPDLVYMNPETKEMKFLFCPFLEQKIENLFFPLAEFLLDVVEQKDNEAVVMAYQFYKIIRNENFVLEEVKLLCERHRDKEEYKTFVNRTEAAGGGMEEVNRESLPPSEEPKGLSAVEETENAQYPLERSREPPVLKASPFWRKRQKPAAGQMGMKKTFLVFTIISILAAFFFINNPKSINSYYKLINLGFLFFGMGGMGISFYLWKHPKSSDGERNGKEINQAEGEAAEYVAPDNNGINYEKEMAGGEEENYGKTQFCLILPENEKRILVERRKGKEVIHQIDRLPFTVGKLKEMSNLYLPDSSVSRMHARIFEEEGKLYLMDLGSTNGTYLNGISINQEEKYQMEAGDEVRFGRLEFVYR